MGTELRRIPDDVPPDRYLWTRIKNLAELKALRMAAMAEFLRDYESGKSAGRYVEHALPDPVALPDQSYGLGLSSHFLLLYENLGYEFHIAAIAEMLRRCRKVRIFPICNLN